MSSDLLVEADTVALVISLSIFILAAYRSFSSRNVLAIPIYRSRALWTGVVSLILAYYAVLQIVVENGLLTMFEELVAYGVLSVVAIVAIFAWIDRTIGVALDMDFLHRDALQWKKLRKYAWVMVLASGFLGSVSTTEIEYIVFTILFAIPVAFSAAVLFRSGPRVHDRVMRAYVRWMGLIVLAFLLLGVTLTINFHVNFPALLVSYLVYRAAVSLSKTTRKLEAAGPNLNSPPPNGLNSNVPNL